MAPPSWLFPPSTSTNAASTKSMAASSRSAASCHLASPTKKNTSKKTIKSGREGLGSDCETVIDRKTMPSRSLDEKSIPSCRISSSLPNSNMRRGGFIEEAKFDPLSNYRAPSFSSSADKLNLFSKTEAQANKRGYSVHTQGLSLPGVPLPSIPTDYDYEARHTTSRHSS